MIKDCPVCKGRGWVMTGPAKVSCDTCNGTGWILTIPDMTEDEARMALAAFVMKKWSIFNDVSHEEIIELATQEIPEAVLTLVFKALEAQEETDG